MKHKNLSGIVLCIFATILTFLVTGCLDDRNSVPKEENTIPDESSYFGFEMRKDVSLSVNYNMEGMKALIEVYAEDPMEVVGNTPVKKEDAEALFKIYTDDNGKYEGKMSIPTTVSKVYLYTSAWGVPGCVELNIENEAVKFDLSKQVSAPQKAATKAYDFDGTVPYKLDTDRNLYSLCRWGYNGALTYDMWGRPITDYIEETSKVGNEPIGLFVYRLQHFLLTRNPSVDNSDLVTNAKTTNLYLKKEASVNVTFVNKDASYKNTFGYYYYKGNSVDVKNVRKYIVFPNVSYGMWPERILECGDKVQLKFFGEDGKATPSDKFPAGYTIGWFIYADGFDGRIFNPSNEIKSDASLITTNDAEMKYIALNDKKSGKVIIGVEDGGNKSYCDLLFYAESTPEDAIEDPNKPDTDPENPDKPDATEKKSGTLAFEDIWPSGGDYDMNDVIVEYRYELTFDKDNKVKKIVQTFTPVHNGAGLNNNTFAYQIDESEPLGWVSCSNEDMVVEKETNSIIVFKDTQKNLHKTLVVTRDFTKGNLPPINKDELKDYNPYLIVGYNGETPRKEVHLPKYKPTDKVDKDLIGSADDAYYIKREGSYPFAIDIPKLGFTPVTEKVTIDSEYPDFKVWAESNGKKATDWYNNYQKKQ